MGRWVSAQRDRYKKYHAGEDIQITREEFEGRIHLLEKIGFQWCGYCGNGCKRLIGIKNRDVELPPCGRWSLCNNKNCQDESKNQDGPPPPQRCKKCAVKTILLKLGLKRAMVNENNEV